MPRYFFHVKDGVDLPDLEGVELPDHRAAQTEAIRTAGALIADGAQRDAIGEDWSMDVTTDNGLILFRLDFHVSGSAAMMGTESNNVDACAGRD